MKHDFFDVISRERFQELLKKFPPTPSVNVSLDISYKKVLTKELLSTEDLPPVSRSSMDGYAISSEDLFGSGDSEPAYLECVAELRVDKYPDFYLNQGECAKIPTGGSLPEGADAVVMFEYTNDMGSGTIEIRKSVFPGENTMLKCEDMTRGDIVLPAGHRIRFQDIGIMAALGITEIPVHRSPRVAIISTGDELTSVDSGPQPGKIRDVNSHVLYHMVLEAGGNPKHYGIVGDDLAKLKQIISGALAENDLVLLSGGSSVGAMDMTVQAIMAMEEASILAHGISISPGKPTILGESCGKPVIGLPGQITSVQIIMLTLIMPFIRHLSGEDNAFSEKLRSGKIAELSRNTPSKQGREDFIRVGLEYRDNEIPLAHPKLGKSGLLKTMLEADGIMIIPANIEGRYAGEEVEIWIL